MTLHKDTVWELRQDGNDDNGGGWHNLVSGVSIDYTQQALPQLSLADLTSTLASVSVSSTIGGFTTAMSGSILQICTGTNAVPGFYELVGVDSSKGVTIDRPCTTGGDMSVGSGNVGGALKTYGMLGKVLNDNRVSGMTAFIKYSATPYDISNSGYNIPSGVIYITSAGSGCYISGYDTTRSLCVLNEKKPTIRLNDIQPHSMFKTLMATDSETVFLGNLIFDCNGTVPLPNPGNGYKTVVDTLGISLDYLENIMFNIKIIGSGSSNTNSLGFYNSHLFFCQMEKLSIGTIYSASYYCYASGCSTPFSTCSRCINCIAYDSLSTSFNSCFSMVNCISKKCNIGYQASVQRNASVINSIFIDSVLRHLNLNSDIETLIFRCASGGIGSRSNISSYKYDIEPILLGSNSGVFENIGINDWRINSGDGTALKNKAAGFEFLNSVNKTQDIGAVQHSDPATTVRFLGIKV